MRKYRFFYHYNREKKKMSIHFRKKCILVDYICCNVMCETKWNKNQPNLVMQGFAERVDLIQGNAYIF